MDALLIAINAKYIHTNNAIRLLKANSLFDVELIDFTIKDSLEDIYESITKLNPTIIGFSTYIWNVEQIKQLTFRIKSDTNIKVILGGPEVSYDPLHFLESTKADVIIKGEGEMVFDKVINALKSHSSLKNIDNISTFENGLYINNKIVEISNLSQLKSPYYFDSDKTHFKHKIAYIETSRGCPYKCSYCLSSLEEKVRFFNPESVQKDILYLIEQGVNTFKFLDRTFNASKHIIPIIDFIIQNHLPKNIFQFEITGDVLNPKIIDYIHEHAPNGLFRFEMGIQSTNEETNRIVDRFQNKEKLFSNIIKIQDQGIIDLHLDLIAGLPKEDLNSFKNTFNEVYNLGAKELQLGFLKMLRGTKIRYQAKLYNYQFEDTAPYEIISNDHLSSHDITIIKQVEKALNLFHNKGYFDEFTFNLIQQNHFNPFDFFYGLYLFIEQSKTPLLHYQIDQLFKGYQDFLVSLNVSPSFIETLKIIYLKRSKVKPKLYFDTVDDKAVKEYCFTEISRDFKVSIDLFYKHSILLEGIKYYHCVLYQNHKASYYSVKKGA